ncbi:hypothetical protein Nmel_011275 [Mimus melanotis]
MGGRMECSWCPHPSLVSVGVVKDTFIPPCCMERGVGEDLALRHVGLGPFREVTEAVGDAPDLGGLRSSPDPGGHSSAHRGSVESTSTGTPEVVFPITLILPGRDETALKSIPTLSARDEIS